MTIYDLDGHELLTIPRGTLKTGLRGAKFHRAFLINADLRTADLSQSNAYWSCLVGANLSGANLEGACFSGANFTVARLINARRSACDLTPGGFGQGVQFAGADLTGAKLEKC